MRRTAYAYVLAVGSIVIAPLWASLALAQSRAPSSEIQSLREEIRRLQERLERIERSQPSAATPASTVAPASPEVPAPSGLHARTSAEPGEREITLERENILESIGLPKPEIAGTRFSGFFVGSASYNSHIQTVPEFAGGATALADPGRTNFRFDKFGLAASRVFAPWLSAAAAIEVESHRVRHTHGFDPDFGCPGVGVCVEQFGSEEAETEVNLDRFHVTGIAPVGNGLALSIGRFDVPFGIERHDEPLNLTATTSEVFQFGRPQRMTGFQVAYQFAPWLDVSAWLVNRWESETTEDPFDDNNRDKSVGGRLGFTPLPREQLLNFGLGGFYGPEQDDRDSPRRWVIDADATWTPIARLLLAAEAIYGSEDQVELRKRGIPFSAPETVVDANWWGLYLLAHYDFFDWLGFSFRYGLFDDLDGARTGVEQTLQSWTFVPVVHLSRLIRDLKPTGATYARTRHPIDWVNLKLEYRLNKSNRPVFSDAKPGVPILEADDLSHQLQLQLVVNF